MHCVSFRMVCPLSISGNFYEPSPEMWSEKTTGVIIPVVWFKCLGFPWACLWLSCPRFEPCLASVFPFVSTYPNAAFRLLNALVTDLTSVRFPACVVFYFPIDFHVKRAFDLMLLCLIRRICTFLKFACEYSHWHGAWVRYLPIAFFWITFTFHFLHDFPFISFCSLTSKIHKK